MIDADEALRRHEAEHDIIQPERIVQHAHGLLLERDHMPLRIGHLIAARPLCRSAAAAEDGEQKHHAKHERGHTLYLHHIPFPIHPSAAAHVSLRPRR